MEKLVIFDLDGTLFRTETVDVESINKALVSNGYMRRQEKDILNLIGDTLEEISLYLLETKDRDILMKFKSDVITFEKEEIAKHGKLYDGVIESLNKMKHLNYRLCICSNGNEEYVTEISRKFELDKIFDDIVFNSSILTKAQRVQVLKQKYEVDSFIMVGDRKSDIEAARLNNGVSIGVTYGFGGQEVFAANYIAHNITEVKDIIMRIFNGPF